MFTESNHSFVATEAKGQVTALLYQVPEAKALFVLAHGAGADMRHNHMEQLATNLAGQGISSLRFNFPYMEQGGRRTDSQAVCLETLANAIGLARQLENSSPIFLSGHSFGGRMGSHLAAQGSSEIEGLIYFSFPLHASQKPSTRRAEHLPDIKLPQLFISGTRDKLADLALLAPIIGKIPMATLHLLDTADHSFKILKRTRVSREDVYLEAARVVSGWLETVCA